MLVSTVLAMTLLGLLLAGYLAWLRGGQHAGGLEPPSAPARWPMVEVLVAVHDEREWIEDKLQNLSELEYPAGLLKIRIIDGASSDGTFEAAASWCRNDSGFEVVRLDVANKTAQLNSALAGSTARWLLVTDADARLRPDTLIGLVAAGEADDDIAVVGAPVQSARGHALEQLHWRIVNRLRQQESRRGCASIVTAPCYLFRRALLPKFAKDVVADDVHVALAAAAAGQRVAVVTALVTELRSPVALADVFRHKVRKADAYLREVVRFWPRIGTMRADARSVFLWRAGQLVLAPFLTGATLVGLVAWVSRGGWPSITHLVAGAATLLA